MNAGRASRRMARGRRGFTILTVVFVIATACAVAAAPVAAAPKAASGTPSAKSAPKLSHGERSPHIPEIDPDHLFVRLRASTGNVSSRIASAGASIQGTLKGTPWTTLDTHGKAAEVRQKLEKDPAVVAVSNSYIRRIAAITDPQYDAAQRAYLQPMRVDRIWGNNTFNADGTGVKVAVVDTGVDNLHPDLAGQVLSGHSEVSSIGSVQDDNGHGTMVAGIIAAKLNTRGIAGIAPGAKILPVKVLDDAGAGNDVDIAAGIQWAVDNGANVINLSLGGFGDDAALDTAVGNAISAGIIVVAAAGNTGSADVGFPAAIPNVIAVSATNASGELTAFSSYGSRIDVAAPGLDITSTALSSNPSADVYDTESGTSFSSPIVAAEAALLKQHFAGFTAAQIRALIKDSATDAGEPGVDAAFGHGIADPYNALTGSLSPLASKVATTLGVDEPNDLAGTATPLSAGVTHNATISPETDVDWYTTALGVGWYKVHVPAGTGAFEHDMQPVIQLYDDSNRLLSSQDFTGGDLVFRISTAHSYRIRVANRGGDTVSYTVTLSTTSQPPLFSNDVVNLLSEAGSVAIGDLNDDGRPDIALLLGDYAGLFSDRLVVLHQTDDRSFVVGENLYLSPGLTGGGLVVADANGDDKPDVLFPTNSSVVMVPQAGGALDVDNYREIFVSDATGTAVADFDNDGDPDVAVSSQSGIYVAWGPNQSPVDRINQTRTWSLNADPTRRLLAAVRTTDVAVFGPPTTRTSWPGIKKTVSNPMNAAVDPTTGQIAVTQQQSSSNLTVLTKSGSTLNTTSTRSIGAYPDPVAIGVVDGVTDVVAYHDDSGAVGLTPLAGGSETRFPADTFASSFYDERALAVGDIDNDGLTDIVAATGDGISILYHRQDSLPTNYGAEFVYNVSPATNSTGASTNAQPTISLSQAATNAATPGVVQLLDDHGTAVNINVTGNGSTSLTITPASALSSGHVYTIRLEGLHDAAGDTVSGFASAFTVGSPPTAPKVTFSTQPDTFVTSATASFVFNSPGTATVTYECSLDDAAFGSCTNPTVALGKHTMRVFATTGDNPPIDSPVATATWTYRQDPHGYWMVGAGGNVYPFGNPAPNQGHDNIFGAVDIAMTPSGYGYWVVDAAGHIYGYGDAKYKGGAWGQLLSGETVVSISATHSGQGYWLFTSLGRVFAKGNATFFTDATGWHLNQPVIDSVASPDDGGYYMVAKDGGVFAFGDAHFKGSTGNIHVSAPIRTLVPDPDGTGYWIIGSDGHVYTFAAPSRGAVTWRLNKPVVGAVSWGNGYLMVAGDGGIFGFSNQPFYGSLGAHPPSIPIVSVSSHVPTG